MGAGRVRDPANHHAATSGRPTLRDMTLPSRALRALLTVPVLLATLAVAGCGGTTPAATPTRTSTTPTSPTSPASTVASPGTQTPTGTPSAAPSPTPSSPRVQVIAVDKFGISFELPKGWITLDAKNVLQGGVDNPFLKQLADRLGSTPEQLVKTFSSAVQTMSVSDAGAVHGFVDNANSLGQEGDLNDDQLKLQLAALGAKPGAITHTSTEAGDVTRVPYSLPAKPGLVIRAVALAVRTGTATVVVTVSSATAARAAAIADQVQGSLKRLPGGGSGL